MVKSRILQRNKLDTKVGQKPGYLYIPENAFPTRLFVISFDDDECTEEEFFDYEAFEIHLAARPDQSHWIDVRGYGNLAMLEKLAEGFNIHPLQLEDVISDYQRPKVQDENGYYFIISRMVSFMPDCSIDDDQLNIFTGKNYVLTFQSDYDDCLEPLRQRIRTGRGSIRKKPVIYMAYAMMDVVIDHYFPVLAEVSDHLDNLEDELFKHPKREIQSRILAIKREVVKLRRIMWPERDKINELLRAPDELVPPEMKIYFKDTYDHVIQIADLIETYKETTGSLMELYLSNVSNRMNEIMKVLTIISSIFIPLSFIVGLYGMNFSRENPDGTVNRLNMPELYHPYGYVTLLLIMAFLISGQIYFFYRKGWLK
jgi:magnesium transporter